MYGYLNVVTVTARERLRRRVPSSTIHNKMYVTIMTKYIYFCYIYERQLYNQLV